MSNIILLIVAGSDTTRHSITGGLLALDQHPGDYARLRADPALLESAVPEIIRWQSPVAYMRRTALADLEIGGQDDPQGREDRHVVRLRQLRRERHSARRPVHHRPHTAARPRPPSAFGIHRCLVGQRLAEMQLRVVWEEMLARFPVIEVTGEPTRLASNFVKGYSRLPVRIPG